jgi:spermidine synthase
VARFSAQDIAPAVTLSEEHGVRYLHFGSPWVQGAMRLRSPTSLEIEYQRHMMAWLLFMQNPARVLQLGLGAGALTKFCLKHLPSTQVQVVEISQEVISCAVSAFHLPLHHERLTVVRQDAWAHLKRQKNNHWPIVQIDLYDWTANGPVYEQRGFYQECYRVLAHDAGVMVVNLFGEHASFGRNLKHIDAVFKGRYVCFAANEASNVVVLAFKGPAMDLEKALLLPRAKSLGRDLNLPAQGWLASLPRRLRF